MDVRGWRSENEVKDWFIILARRWRNRYTLTYRGRLSGVKTVVTELVNSVQVRILPALPKQSTWGASTKHSPQGNRCSSWKGETNESKVDFS